MFTHVLQNYDLQASTKQDFIKWLLIINVATIVVIMRTPLLYLHSIRMEFIISGFNCRLASATD